MISQRSSKRLPVVQAFAEFLPFKDNSFDAVMAILTIHHWSNIERGLKEAVRVAKKQLVLLTWIGFVEEFWLLDYLSKIKEMDKPLFPSIDDLTRLLGQVRVIPVPIPHDCKDGFLCAYWRRPQAYLDEDVRRAISTFSRVTDFEDGLKTLAKDLNSGVWYQRYGSLLNHEQMDLRLQNRCLRQGSGLTQNAQVEHSKKNTAYLSLVIMATMKMTSANISLQSQLKALEAIVLKNSAMQTILERTPELSLPNWYLGAGCIAQTVWNFLSRRDLLININDADLVYFDDTDLSFEAEAK